MTKKTGIIIKFLEQILGVAKLDNLSQKFILSNDQNPFKNVASLLNLKYQLTEDSVRNIPKDKSLLILANHPTGGADPIIIMKILLEARDDIKILSHVWFKRYSIFENYSIFVNPQAKNSDDFRLNELAMISAIEWVNSGKALLIFPAGEVSYFDIFRFKAVEPEWKKGLLKIISQTTAQILPIRISAKNSLLYYFVSAFFRNWRFLFLAKELLNKSQQTYKIQIKPIFNSSEIKINLRDMEIMEFMKKKVLDP